MSSETDISIPNPIFEVAKNLAQELNIPLSELYTIAITDYATAFKQEKDITAQLNAVYKNKSSEIDAELVSMQISSVGGECW